MADVENPPSAVPLEVSSASAIPVDATQPTTTAKTNVEGDISMSGETPEAHALAQGWCYSIVSHLRAYSREIMTLIVEFYFADANLPYDKWVHTRYL